MSGDAMDSLGYALEESDTARATWRGTAKHLIEHYPDVLLAALAEAGVLREERAALRPCGCKMPEGDMSACCLMTDVLNATPGSRYVTEWRPTDD